MKAKRVHPRNGESSIKFIETSEKTFSRHLPSGRTSSQVTPMTTSARKLIRRESPTISQEKIYSDVESHAISPRPSWSQLAPNRDDAGISVYGTTPVVQSLLDTSMRLSDISALDHRKLDECNISAIREAHDSGRATAQFQYMDSSNLTESVKWFPGMDSSNQHDSVNNIPGKESKETSHGTRKEFNPWSAPQHSIFSKIETPKSCSDYEVSRKNKMTVIAPGSKFAHHKNQSPAHRRKFRDWEVEDDMNCDGPFRMMKKINTVEKAFATSGKKGGIGRGDRVARDETLRACNGPFVKSKEIRAEGFSKSGNCITFC
jgi:hypothetical protein